MKVIRLQAENLKKIIAVDITPEGAVVQITGKNGAGKSSVLDSIFYALGGERNIPDEPIRKGEKTAKVTLDLGDLIVERKWTGKGTYLVVTNKDGLKHTNPQKVLDALCGKLTFDPLEFTRLKPEEQAKTLALLVGLDLTEIDAKRVTAYNDRRDLNRDLKRMEAECASLPTVAPTLLDVRVAEEMVREIRAQDRLVSSHEMNLLTASSAVKNAREAFDKAIAAVTEARRKAATLEMTISEAEERLEAVSKDAPKPLDTTLEEAMQAVRLATDSETAMEKWTVAENTRALVKKRTLDSEALTQQIEAMDAEAAAAIAACEFPLPELKIADGVVRYGPVPFDQCSSAEQLRISTAIAMKMNPKLRILRISDGSLLDHDSMRMLEELAESEDYQLWVEICSDDADVGFVIEAGRVISSPEMREKAEEAA